MAKQKYKVYKCEQCNDCKPSPEACYLVLDGFDEPNRCCPVGECPGYPNWQLADKKEVIKAVVE